MNCKFCVWELVSIDFELNKENEKFTYVQKCTR